MGWSGKVYLLSSAIPLHVLLGFQKELIANSLQSLKSNFKWATMYSLPTKAVLTVSGIQKWPLNFQIQWNYNSPSFYLIDLIHLILLSTFFRKLYLLLLLGPWSWSFICLFLALAGCYSPFLIHWILYVSGFCFWSLITLYKLLGQMLVAFILPVNSSLSWSIFTRSMLYLMRHFENLWWLKKKNYHDEWRKRATGIYKTGPRKYPAMYRTVLPTQYWIVLCFAWLCHPSCKYKTWL